LGKIFEHSLAEDCQVTSSLFATSSQSIKLRGKFNAKCCISTCLIGEGISKAQCPIVLVWIRSWFQYIFKQNPGI